MMGISQPLPAGQHVNRTFRGCAQEVHWDRYRWYGRRIHIVQLMNQSRGPLSRNKCNQEKPQVPAEEG